jgi:hypothetical protein
VHKVGLTDNNICQAHSLSQGNPVLFIPSYTTIIPIRARGASTNLQTTLETANSTIYNRVMPRYCSTEPILRVLLRKSMRSYMTTITQG